ncbi:hypothetical protein ABEH87_05605 [Erwinia sp. Eh17-17]|jgi:hypothetical protein
MNSVLLFFLLLAGAPLMGFLVIISACLPGVLLTLWHQFEERMHLRGGH